MKKLPFFFFLFSLNFVVLAQDTLIYDIVEKTAQPEKGYPEFYDFLRKNINIKVCKELRNNIFIEGVIDEQGNYQLKSFKPECLDWEATKQVLETTKWIPAENKGKKVKQRMIIPIHIKLG